MTIPIELAIQTKLETNHKDKTYNLKQSRETHLLYLFNNLKQSWETHLLDLFNNLKQSWETHLLDLFNNWKQSWETHLLDLFNNLKQSWETHLLDLFNNLKQSRETHLLDPFERAVTSLRHCNAASWNVNFICQYNSYLNTWFNVQILAYQTRVRCYRKLTGYFQPQWVVAFCTYVLSRL